MLNDIIIIGGDHHNTLAALRCFGRKKCPISKVVIHCENDKQRRIKIKKSKFAKNKVIVIKEDEMAIVDFLTNSIEHSQNKTVLFPCSDFAAFLIDHNHDLLTKYYIMPGFKDRPGEVCLLMDKWNQYDFATKNHFLMAKTWVLNSSDSIESVLNSLDYPCIVKPRVSAFGLKSDIRICSSKVEAKDALNSFFLKKYDSLIVQQFKEKQYEVCSFGCLLSNHPTIKNSNMDLEIIGGSIKKIREFPPKGGGSLTFASFIEDEKINSFLSHVLKILHDSGYNGMYDIEFLVCDDDIYLNEINFRHSGNGYALIENGVYAPYYWYLDVIDKHFDQNEKLSIREGFMMDELSDLHHRKDNRISFSKWTKDVKKTSAFAVYSKHDKRGSLYYYLLALFSFLKK